MLKLKIKIFINGVNYIGQVEANSIEEAKTKLTAEIVKFYMPVNNGKISGAVIDASIILKKSTRAIWKHLRKYTIDGIKALRSDKRFTDPG